MPDIECEHCGGTDFYKEAGYFFCKGCQVQSQEVQEYVFDDYLAENRPKTKKIHSTKSEKTDNKITSWECYNYILLGLTDELIKLGANKQLKAVVRILWLRYLEKLQVIKRGNDGLPKLQALCSEVDGEIVYGKLAKRKRKRNKSSSSELDATSVDSSSMKHERGKRKRALIKAQYDDFTQKSQGTSSLHNETLTSLQTGSEKSAKHVTPIAYNIYAAKELRRIKRSKCHWSRHRKDFDHNLKCHKFSYRKTSKKYNRRLLIVQDKIQLCDILRFIKEGHLSFNCYDHFFPDEFSDKVLNFRNFKKNCVFGNAPYRKVSLEMATFLQVDYYISCPDLVELCERYCRELNLPHQICDCAKNLLSRSNCKMSVRNSTKVPNYEGRILSIILFLIKLLFGLDDSTEFHLGKYSEILNTSPPMFNVIKWLKYIEYRNLVMTNQHFPTNFNNSEDPNISLVLSALARKQYPSEPKTHATKDNYKQLLGKLKDAFNEPESIDFPATLTPFLDYSRLLPKRGFLKLLSEDFRHHSLTHILKPTEFVNMLEPEVVNGGANLDWVVENVTCPREEHKRDLRKRRKLVTVKLSLNHKSKRLEQNAGVETDALVEDYQAANESHFERNRRRLEGERCRRVLDFDLEKIRQGLGEAPEAYSKHYNPYERFWVRCKVGIDDMSHKEFSEFFKGFPNNFQLVFKECQRIAEQSAQELWAEYQFTELYLIYLVKYGKATKVIRERLVSNYLQKLKHLW